MFSKLKWVATAAAIAMIPAATLAQPAAKPPEKPTAKAAAPKSVDEVIVTAAPTTEARVEIDRRSYDVTKSVQASTGTLADMLRTVPSVDVDTQGNVSLRGDQSVTIMIDGKPSGMFKGDARSSAVQNLPASQFERVEVITNPSAADSPEGTGGIINLVSKQGRRAGGSGSVRATENSRGQYGGGISATYNTSKLTLSGDLSGARRAPSIYAAQEDRRQTISPGVERTSRQVTSYNGLVNPLSARAAADYDIDPRRRVGAQLRSTIIKGGQEGHERLDVQENGVPVASTDRFTPDNAFRFIDQEISASFRRKLGDDQEWTGSARQERAAVRNGRDDRNVFSRPSASDQFAEQFNSLTTNTTGLKADYRNPLANSGELKIGYDGRIDRTFSELLYAQGSSPTGLVAVPGRNGAFSYRLDLNAAYVTLQHKFGDLTVLGGVRVEDSRTEVSTPGQSHVVSLLRPYPSLHLNYPLGGERKLSASYSRRVDRPLPAQLSPIISYGDPQNLYGGNPDLRPQETDSYELAYDARKGPNSIAATLFYRELHNAFTPTVRDIGGGVLLFSPANLGRVQRVGLSLAANRQLTPKLSLNISGDGYWTQIRVNSIGLGELQSAYVLGGRAGLTWTPTPNDFFQIDGRLFGKQLTAQGYVSPLGVLNLGYRRKLTPQLFVNVTAQNVLDSNHNRLVLKSPGLDFARRGESVGPTVAVTLTYNFGGGSANKPRDPALDFGGGGPPSATP
jgi:outer membrane receptor protein involved in Fe transport